MGESRADKVIRNVASNIVQMALNILINFGGRIIFVQILDASFLGINGLFSNVLTILSLADMGMTTAMMYHLYKPIAQKDQNRIRDLIGYFRKIYVIIASVVLCVGLALIPFLKYIINLEREIPHIYVYYILALLNVVISYLFVYRTTLVIADQKNYILNKYIIGFKISTFIAQSIVLLLFKSYFIYLLVALILNFVCNLFQNRVALKLYPYLKEKIDDLEKEEKCEIFDNVKSLFLYKVAGTVQSNTDNILISIFVGTVTVGYYSNYSLITSQIVNVITLIFGSLKASVGNLIADVSATIEKKWKLFNILELMNFWIVCFCSISLVVLLDDFIVISFGKEYVLGIGTVIAIVLNFYTSNIRQTIWAYRETTGIFVETKYITLVTAIINLFSSIIFGYLWGIKGILYATTLSRMVYAWWREPQVLFKNVFNTGVSIYYTTYIKRFILCIILGILSYYIANFFSITNIYVLFIYKIFICCLVPNICLLLIYWKSEELKYARNRILKK